MRQRRWMPVGLLLLVVFGLFWMHSVGHSPAGHDGPPMPGSHHGVTSATASGHDPAAIQMTVLAPGAPATAMNPMAMCIAVLSTLVLVAGLSVLRRRPRAAPAPWSHAFGAGGPGRGPPGPVFGLLVADLSVLRH